MELTEEEKKRALDFGGVYFLKWLEQPTPARKLTVEQFKRRERAREREAEQNNGIIELKHLF